MAEDPEGPLTQPLERKLATILAADVAEYSRMMAEDEEQTLRTFRRHKRVFESLVAAHRGRVFNTAGDAILAEFPSAVEAMRCATEIQTALHTANEQLAPARRVRFRIGVNLGDVMMHGEDLLGDGVNVAARLQAEAEPGGICISGSIHDQIRNKLSLTFKPLGEKRLKNIPQPVRTFSVITTETQGVLPSPRRFSLGPVRWLGAAALALLVVAGGYWAYAERQRSAAEQARLREETTRQEAALREARLTAERLAAEQAQQRANAERQALETARRDMQIAAERAAADTERRKAAAAEAERRKTETSKPIAAVPAAPPAPSAPPAASHNGVYAGPLCFAAGAGEPPRCHRAQATVDGSRISGQWPGARDGVTVVLRGNISPSGDVKIQMHGENAQGGPVARADLTGTLRDGRLEAAGSFRNGRAVNLTWRKE